MSGKGGLYVQLCLTMKMRLSFLILLTAALPMLATMAEDTAKTETTNSQNTSDAHNKTSTGKDQMACKGDTTTADLDKLIADMNGATADKKVDAIVAAVTKLAQELKTQQQPKTTTSEKSEMDMCNMMMGMTMKHSGDSQEGDHEHHH
jgi:hypothetical protein